MTLPNSIILLNKNWRNFCIFSDDLELCFDAYVIGTIIHEFAHLYRLQYANACNLGGKDAITHREKLIEILREDCGHLLTKEIEDKFDFGYLVELQLYGEFLNAQRLESIGLLAAGIAHDLNNVLAPIMFVAPLLRRSLSNPQDLKVLATLEQSAARGAGLVKQILGFAHTGTSELHLTQVKHLARDIVSVIEQTFPKSIHLEPTIPTDLWPVFGNATQIHQMLLNLCINARDSMPQGGTLRLTARNRRLDAVEAGAIAGARPGPWIVIEIADTGTGIPPEILARIWEPFFTTKAVGKGTGLGLSTVRGLVASHQGFIELHTEVGRGSVFRLFLPAADSESGPPGTAAPFVIPDGAGELILVVDDDTSIREIVAKVLVNHGYRVVSCKDGVEAIALFATQSDKLVLVITDINMPYVGGAVLVRALLQIRPDIRLIAMSGLDHSESDDLEVQEVEKLVHVFLRKPFKADDLLKTVHRLLHPAGKA